MSCEGGSGGGVVHIHIYNFIIVNGEILGMYTLASADRTRHLNSSQ